MRSRSTSRPTRRWTADTDGSGRRGARAAPNLRRRAVGKLVGRAACPPKAWRRRSPHRWHFCRNEAQAAPGPVFTGGNGETVLAGFRHQPKTQNSGPKTESRRPWLPVPGSTTPHFCGPFRRITLTASYGRPNLHCRLCPSTHPAAVRDARTAGRKGADKFGHGARMRGKSRMCPDRKLTRLAVHTATLWWGLAARRSQCAEAAAQGMQPLDGNGPHAGIPGAPLADGDCAGKPAGQPHLYPRLRMLGPLVNWGPLVPGALRAVHAAITPRFRSPGSAIDQN